MTDLARIQMGLREQDFTEYEMTDVNVSSDAILFAGCCQPYNNNSIWNL